MARIQILTMILGKQIVQFRLVQISGGTGARFQLNPRGTRKQVQAAKVKTIKKRPSHQRHLPFMFSQDR
jgi:hypothetical protein